MSNLIPGLRSVDITARVVRVFEPREFSRNGKAGIVQTLMLADGTGRVRMPLWNEETKLLSEGKIKEDDVVRIEGGFTKENRGAAELRLGKGKMTV
ncbi:MAG: SOSS complex subunit B family protein, partial [Nanoarchaeota archaeon]